MIPISPTEMRKDFYNVLNAVSDNHTPYLVTGQKSQAVIISKEDWDAIEETLYLLSIPGMRETIIKGINTPWEECKKLEDVDSDLRDLVNKASGKRLSKARQDKIKK